MRARACSYTAQRWWAIRAGREECAVFRFAQYSSKYVFNEFVCSAAAAARHSGKYGWRDSLVRHYGNTDANCIVFTVICTATYWQPRRPSAAFVYSEHNIVYTAHRSSISARVPCRAGVHAHTIAKAQIVLSPNSNTLGARAHAERSRSKQTSSRAIRMG